MGYQVFKFGGSSLANAEAISKVVDIIQREEKPVAVIVSAMAGITDTLEALARQAAGGSRADEDVQLDILYQRHHEVITSMISPAQQGELIQLLDDSKVQLSAIFNSLDTLRELTPRVMATTVSFGERLTARMVSSILTSRNHQTSFLDATEIIKLTKEVGQFVPDMERSTLQAQNILAPLLAKGDTVLVPGFIGETPNGDVMTLGRGGSDYSATLLGAFLNADRVVLYKEVDGILTADPRHVNNTRVVPELHYREAAELAYYGAKVLHPRSIIPLLPHKIPLVIKNTFKPELPGTRITGDASPGAYPVKALTANTQQAIVSVEGKGMMGVPGIAARTFSALAGDNISVSLISQASSESSICFVVPHREAFKARELLEFAFKYEIEHGLIDEVKLKQDQCVIALVGLGMSGTHGIAARAFQCMHRQSININAIAQGSSELNISVVIEESQMSLALKTLHQEYRLDRIKALHQKDSSEVNLMIYGFGQIGQTLVQQIEGQKDYFNEKLKIKAPIVSVADSSAILLDHQGLDSPSLNHLLKLKQSGKKLNSEKSSRKLEDIGSVLKESSFHRGVFVDLTAVDTAPLIRKALEHHFHVVVANKKPLAIPYKEYQELFAMAEQRGLTIRYEATVGAGLPVLDTIEKLNGAGDEIYEISGCLSGTIGYILTEVEDGATLSEAIQKAYDNGYTEPDPREDLSGMDVARKALILARTLGIEVNMEDIALESFFTPELSDPDAQTFINNMKKIDEQFSNRIQKAKAENCVLRYVARLSSENVSVGIEQLPIESPLAQLRGTANQVEIRTKRYNDNPLIVTGPGAGADVTAAGVLNDVIAIAASQERSW